MAHQKLIAYPFSAAMHIMTPITLLDHIHPLIKKGYLFKTSPTYLLYKQYKQMFFLILPSMILKNCHQFLFYKYTKTVFKHCHLLYAQILLFKFNEILIQIFKGEQNKGGFTCDLFFLK